MAEEKTIDYTAISELIRRSKSVDTIIETIEHSHCKIKNADKYHRFINDLCLAKIPCADKIKLVEAVHRKANFDESLTLVYFNIMCDVLFKLLHDADLYAFAVFMISNHQPLYLKNSSEFRDVCYLLKDIEWPTVNIAMMGELFATKARDDTLFGYFALCIKSSSPQVYALLDHALKTRTYQCTNNQNHIERMRLFLRSSKFGQDQKLYLSNAFDANLALPPAPVAHVRAQRVPFEEFLAQLRDSRDFRGVVVDQHASTAKEFKQLTFLIAFADISVSEKLELVRTLIRNAMLKGDKYACDKSVWGLFDLLSVRSEEVVDFIEDVIERSHKPCLDDEQFGKVMIQLVLQPEATKIRLVRALMDNVKCKDVAGVCRLINLNTTEEGAALVKDVLKMQKTTVSSEDFKKACERLCTAQFSDESKVSILALLNARHDAAPRSVRALFMLAPGSSSQELANFILDAVKACPVACFAQHQKITAVEYLARSSFTQQHKDLIKSAIDENTRIGSMDFGHFELCAVFKKFAKDESPQKIHERIESCTACCVQTDEQFLSLFDLLLSSEWSAHEILATVRVLLKHIVYYTDNEVARQVLAVCNSFTSEFVDVVVGLIKSLKIKCIQSPAQFGRFIVKMRLARITDADLTRLTTAIFENMTLIN